MFVSSCVYANNFGEACGHVVFPYPQELLRAVPCDCCGMRSCVSFLYRLAAVYCTVHSVQYMHTGIAGKENFIRIPH